MTDAANPTNRTRAHITYDLGEARRQYGKVAFKVDHDLVGNPLFELEALAELCERLPQDMIEHDAGNRDIVASDPIALGTATTVSADVLRGIAARPGFVPIPTTVPGLPRQAGYQELYEQILEGLAVEVGVGDLRDHHAVIFISSGGNTTLVAAVIRTRRPSASHWRRSTGTRAAIRRWCPSTSGSSNSHPERRSTCPRSRHTGSRTGRGRDLVLRGLPRQPTIFGTARTSGTAGFESSA